MHKKKFAAVILSIVITVVIICLVIPCSNLPKSRAQSIQWDGAGNRLLTQEESEFIAKQQECVSFYINLSGSYTTHGRRIILFFNDRTEQTILYCIDDGMLYLTIGKTRYIGKDMSLYNYLLTLASEEDSAR